jgi:hypothetical protein
MTRTVTPETQATPSDRLPTNPEHVEPAVRLSLEAQDAFKITNFERPPENPGQNPEIAAMLAGFALLEREVSSNYSDSSQQSDNSNSFMPAWMQQYAMSGF